MNSTTINCILFVVITYVLTWTLVWSGNQYLLSLVALVPATVAISLTIYNKERVRDLFKLSSLKNCLLGFVIILVVVMLSICLLWSTVTVLDLPFLKIECTLEKVKDFNIAMLLFGMLMTFVIVYIVFCLGEEIGWRGYLLKNLKSQIPNFYARALIVGLIWAIWHIPIWKAVSLFLEDGLTFRVLVFYILFICTMSIILTWLFEKDNSVWPVTIAHATNNFITQYIPMLFIAIPIPMPNYVDVAYRISFLASCFIIGIGVIWFDKARGRRLSNS